MDQNRHIYAIILAGGEGTRFVPYSTPEKPKQFLHITDGSKTMIQQTFERISEFVAPERCFISTNDRYRDLVAEQLPTVPKENIIGEPKKKNTAPAIALAASLIAHRDPEAVTLFLPADHYIADIEGAVKAFRHACDIAAEGDNLVTFGIPPTFPSPDYGYIKREGDKLASGAYRVERFVEKPDVETAEKYLESGQYYWNSGMFVWQAKVLLDAVKEYLPKMDELLGTIEIDDAGAAKRSWVDAFFNDVESISIDYGVMEKASNVIVIPFDVRWSDVGTWKGLSELAQNFHIELPATAKKHLDEQLKG